VRKKEEIMDTLYRTVEIFFCWLKFQDSGHLFGLKAVGSVPDRDPYVFLNIKNMKK
jgi:hypothetical protein